MQVFEKKKVDYWHFYTIFHMVLLLTQRLVIPTVCHGHPAQGVLTQKKKNRITSVRSSFFRVSLSCGKRDGGVPRMALRSEAVAGSVNREHRQENPPEELRRLCLFRKKLQTPLYEVSAVFCGKRGIRTPGASQLAGFQDRCNRPLYHLSLSDR